MTHRWTVGSDGTFAMPHPPETAICGDCGCEMILTGKRQPHVLFRIKGQTKWTVGAPECVRPTRDVACDPYQENNMTLNEFSQKLKDKKYKTPTDAKRSFGRAGFSPAERKRALTMIDRAFGTPKKKG